LANYQQANPDNSGSRGCTGVWDPEAGSIFDSSRGKVVLPCLDIDIPGVVTSKRISGPGIF
jgi:hypothetical protein